MCSWYKNTSEFGCMFTVDGEGRLQEPSKRQRRWNTGKNDIDVKAPPKVLQTESVKEETSSEVKETAAPSLATLPLAVPASSTPKSASGLERVAISRPAVSRSDVPVNGETQKTRVGAFFRRLTLHLV